MVARRSLGRCSFLFLLAVSSDVLGLSLILVGIFVNLELNGRSFGEFLIYSGGILLFFSLLWWLAWYSLNLEVSLEELMKEPPVPPTRSSLVELARKVSESFSKRSRRKAEPPGSLRRAEPPGSLELSGRKAEPPGSLELRKAEPPGSLRKAEPPGSLELRKAEPPGSLELSAGPRSGHVDRLV